MRKFLDAMKLLEAKSFKINVYGTIGITHMFQDGEVRVYDTPTNSDAKQLLTRENFRAIATATRYYLWTAGEIMHHTMDDALVEIGVFEQGERRIDLIVMDELADVSDFDYWTSDDESLVLGNGVSIIVKDYNSPEKVLLEWPILNRLLGMKQ